MKKFKQNYQIQVQIRLVRNYEIHIHQKIANPHDLYPNPNPCSSLLARRKLMFFNWKHGPPARPDRRASV